ncbi:RdRP-domain-containing protein [Exidia glandulosa HHB12029]|uniref:RNA-dependent RNA polymerase n=1 Tax=Exidia glandulosa HHB12029 TaxID=1314781 RepID=A0A165ITA8_EXIGL|nr:RdRP-domain-containing protein [Exidia glandulosa HHB12029]
MFSIVVRITSVKQLFYGYDYGRGFFVFHLATAPAFEKGPNVNRDTEAQKKDLENIRQRLTYLDDAHRPSAPYAYQLLVEPLDEAGFNDFLKKRVFACLPKGEDVSPPVEPSKQLHFRRLDTYGMRVMDRLSRWLQNLDFVLAFQVEALFRNVLIDPASLLAMQTDLDKLMRSAYSVGVKSDIIRQFASLIRKKIPQGVLYSDANDLRALLKQAETDNLNLLERTVARQAKALVKQGAGAKKTALAEDGLLPQVVDTSAFLCYHVTITPTAIQLEGPFPVLSNRVLRKYSEHQHCFCRVHFTDEEHNQFRWEREVDGHEFVRTRVGGILKQGFELAGRHFDFLAYSFGALKEHTVWFVTPFDWHVTEHGQKRFDAHGRPIMQYVNAEYIRTALGDFSKVIRCPSQYGARLSQAFSATYPSIRVSQDEIRHIEDIFDGQDGVRLMSDGCAPCSPQLAADIDAVLMHGKIRDEDQHAPRAYQMRIGGSKGMIYVDPRLDGRVLCLRPSMNKFDAPDSLDIEVSNVPRASAMYLNRPLVMVLEDLGVRLATFLRLQQEEMEKTLDAAKSIERFRIMLSQLKLGSRFNVHYVLGNLADMGFGFQDDCSDDMGILLGDYFYYEIVRSTVWDVFRKIKYQARIRVPDSWTLVGVLDEHGILGPGEVMVYIQDSEYPNGYFLKGKILICRSPVVHPGDVQMVTAVVPPAGSELDKERLANCVVFSGTGARSIASALGGGDLDGDLFHVSEYRDLHVVQPYRPAEYAAGEKRLLDRDATIDDVADFVVEFINSNVLGLVSTTHLIIADQHPDGVRTAKCMKLAELHSLAVDYAKTGIPVPQVRIPHFEFPAKPDWKADEVGDPNSAEFYPSQRALGHLYRRVQLAAVNPTMRVKDEEGKEPDDIDRLPLPSKTAQEVDDAITVSVRDRIEQHIEDLDAQTPQMSVPMANIFTQYVYELRRICTLHALHINSPLTEMEVMLGTILRKSAQPKRRKELAARMHVHTSQLVRAVQAQLTPTGEGDDDRHAVLKAWHAWLYVAQLPLEQTRRGMEKPFGAKSFGMIALGVIFKLLDTLDQRPAMDDGPVDSADYEFDFDE